eukprot:TRINITY_DN2693_c0_g1_i1.p1 TRINITY_DN2693_c0_g1~~TRINITY_DN2693_c0_g1_i1.p1  ORF type:complete len:324 (+),score=19.27 TRINITY_DN2693_c0_g1_i1:90-1061(+)
MSIHFGPCFVLSLLYLLLTIAEGFQIARIIYYRHNLFSFQCGFLLLCFTWGIARWLFFLLVCIVESNAMSISYLYWLTFNLQFATFSLLVLFYAYVVNKHKSEAWRKRSLIVYVIVNVLFLCIMLALLVSLTLDQTSNALSELFPCCVGSMFLFLVLILAYYGWQVADQIRSSNLVTPLIPKGDSPLMIVIVTMIIVVLYVSRCIYDFISAFDSSLAISLGSYCASYDSSNILYCLVFVVWELTPTTLVLFLFWRIPKSPVTLGMKSTTVGPYNPVPQNVDTSGTSLSPSPYIFDNPLRYDSDTEEGTSNSMLFTPYPTSRVN